MSVRKAMVLGLAGVGLLVAAPPATPAPECVATESVTVYGKRYDPALELSTSVRSLKPAAGFSATAAALVKVKFAVTVDDPRPWRVTVYDDTYHVVANFTAEDLRKGAGGARWTGILPGDSIAVLSAAPDSPVTVGITGLIVYPPQSAETRYFSTQSTTPAWKPLYSAGDPQARQAGAAVGMIYGSVDTAAGGQVNWCCTGVMVSEDLMLTNHHCGAAPGMTPWTGEVCENTVVDLARDDRAGVRQQYACAGVPAQSAALDYAVVKLKPVVGGSQYVGAPVHRSLAARAAGVPTQHLFAIHHAQCKPKLVSRDCTAERKSPNNDASDDEIGHTCDTEPGASGAPVFDEDGALVALHHRGFPRDGACRVVGRPLNYAVLISRIVADLQQRTPEVARALGVPSSP